MRVILRVNTPAVFVGAMKRLPAAYVDLDKIRKELTVSNGIFYQQRNKGLSTVDTEASWELFREVPGAVLVPRHYKPEFNDGVVLPSYDVRPKPGPRGEVKHVITLRDEIQVEAARALMNPGDKILAIRCGGGKTVLALYAAAENEMTPTLIVVNTTSLLDQWRDRIMSFWNLRSEDIGHIQGKIFTWKGKRVAIAMLHTLTQKVFPDEFYNYWRLVIMDECFPPKTLVDGREIQTLSVGDVVTAFDEKTRIFAKKKITHVFRNKTSLLLKFTFFDGSELITTPNHPIWTHEGWRPATCLRPYDEVGCVDESLRSVQSGISTEVDQSSMFPNVFRGVQEGSYDKTGASAAKDNRGALSYVRGSSVLYNKKREKSVLQRSDLLLRRTRANYAENELGTRYAEGESGVSAGNCSSNEDQQSFVESAYSKEDARDQGTEWNTGPVYLRNEGREWSTIDGCAGAFEATTGGRVDSGVRGPYGTARTVANPLQNRLSEPTAEDCDRSRWQYSQECASKTSRQNKDSIFAWKRVASIEVLQSGGDGEFERVCPEGVVYNLEVEDFSTYVANGVVVHNCHRLGAETFSRACSLFPAERWGLSATVKRADRNDAVFRFHLGKVAFEDLVQPLIPKVFFMDTKITTNQARFTYRGQLNLASLTTWLAEFEKRNDIVLHWLQEAASAGRTVLVLGERITQLQYLFKNLNVESKSLHIGSMKSEERKEALTKQVVLATQHLAKEGLDREQFDTLFIIVPFTSEGRIQQSVGRILRDSKNKQEPRVFVFEDNISIIRAMARKMRTYFRRNGFQMRDVIVGKSENERRADGEE